MRIAMERPRRGTFGSFFKILFILFNVAMAIWLVVLFYSMHRAEPPAVPAAAIATRDIMAVSSSIAVSLIVGIWACGAVILGLLTHLTRGREVRGSG